jgi:hypothetical protein
LIWILSVSVYPANPRAMAMLSFPSAPDHARRVLLMVYHRLRLPRFEKPAADDKRAGQRGGRRPALAPDAATGENRLLAFTCAAAAQRNGKGRGAP